MNKKVSKKFTDSKQIGKLREKFTYIKQGKNYKAELDLFLRDTGLSDDDPVSFINEESVYKWIKVMNERGLRPASINHYLIALRVFVNFLNENNMISLKIHLPKIQDQQLKFYSKDELQSFMNYDKNDFTEHRTYVIICFILSTGARASTVSSLKWEDLDYKNKEVYYRHLKNKKTAILPLPDSLIHIIKDFQDNWEITSDYLFPDCYGNQLTVSAMRQAMNRYCKRRNVKPKSMHALRHSFAREYVKNGGDAFTLQKYLTHSSMEMTRRYVNLFNDDLREASNNYIPLGKLLPTSSKMIRRRF